MPFEEISLLNLSSAFRDPTAQVHAPAYAYSYYLFQIFTYSMDVNKRLILPKTLHII